MSGNYSKRFEHLLAGQEALRSRQQARSATERRDLEAAYDALEEGTANLEQYSRLAAPEIKQGRRRWKPTVLLGQARRNLGLESGHRLETQSLSYLPGYVLSHAPNEQLGADVRSELEQADELVRSQHADPDQRLMAAVARLVVGPGDGEKGRSKIWATAEMAARTQFCDYKKWWNSCILPLSVWNELDGMLDHLSQEAGHDPVPADHHHVTVYKCYQQLLMNRYGGSRPDDRPDRIQQPRN